LGSSPIMSATHLYENSSRHCMSQASKINQSSLSETDLPVTTDAPTQAGTYWFQAETMPRAVMVDVRMTDGELMVTWLTRPDESVANLKGHWRGPIRASSGPGSR
jgi:hypothetical protein